MGEGREMPARMYVWNGLQDFRMDTTDPRGAFWEYFQAVAS